MTSTDQQSTEPAEQPLELTANAKDFAATDVNTPLGNAKKIDCYEATTLYRSAAKEELEKQNQAGERVYAMLGAVCSFYFKPSEPNEPFGPMNQSAEGRSAQPSDFRGEPVGILAEQIERVSHLGVRARIADTVWLLDRKQAVAGVAAINSYAGIVQAIIDQTNQSRQDDKHEHNLEIPDYLRRSLQIGKAIGWDKEPVLRVRQLVADMPT